MPLPIPSTIYPKTIKDSNGNDKSYSNWAEQLNDHLYNESILVVDNIEQLKKLNPTDLSIQNNTQFKNVYVKGYYTPNDGGGGLFSYNKDSLEKEDKGLVFLPGGIVNTFTIPGAYNDYQLQNNGVEVFFTNSDTPGRFERIIESNDYNIKWFGAKGDNNFDNSEVIQRTVYATAKNKQIIAPQKVIGQASIIFPSGIFLHSKTIIFREDLKITSPAARSALIKHTSSVGWQFIFGSKILQPYTDPNRFAMTSLEVENLMFEGESSGHIFGTVITPFIHIKNCSYNEFLGRALDFGDAVYFIKMESCSIMKSGGVRVREYCDLFACDQCIFGFNHGIDLDLATVTYYITNTNFELSLIDTVKLEHARLIIPSEAANGNNVETEKIAPLTLRAKGGYGTIHACRWGSEAPGGDNTPSSLTVTKYDIYITSEESWDLQTDVNRTDILKGLKITNCQFLSNAIHTDHTRTCPILLNSGIMNSQFSNNTVSNYSSLYYIQPKQNIDITQKINMKSYNNVSNNTYPSHPKIAGAFIENYIPNLILQNAYTQRNISKFTAVKILWDNISNIWQMPSAATMEDNDSLSVFAGVARWDYIPGDKVSILKKGSIFQSTLDSTGKNIGDPVYIGNLGVLSLQPDNLNRIVGTILNIKANCFICLI